MKDAGEKYGETAGKTDEYRLKLNNAKAALESVELDPSCKDLLLGMADFFVERLN